ncbi:phage tail tube protein [Kitasatospora purpeofusca]|uniref:phage tail tube protein n=1 Tax=Kitasatospora purpeofusca TaxID=67352 RepID=UPI0038007D8E
MASTQQRFMRRGITKIFFLKTIAAPSNIPTRAELTAGTDLSKQISDIEGWSLENSPIETPDLGNKFATSIPGEDKAASSSLTFYEDLGSEVVEALLAKDTAGYVCILRKGDVPQSKSLDVFPVRVGSRAPSYSTGAEPAKYKVSFSISDLPTLDAPVPAAAAG